MNERNFRERLALEPVVRDLSSLPVELRRSAERDDALRRIVRERIRLDALLDEVDELVPSATFTDDVVRAAYRGDRTGARHLVPLRTKLAAAAAIAAILAVGLLLTRDRSDADPNRVAQENPAATAEDPEMLARLDLFLDDWEEVLGHEDELDMVASLAVAEVLDALPDESDTPR